MKVIPINNVCYDYNSRAQRNTTAPIKSMSFGSLFSKSLNDKFEDGINALDGNSVFIFCPEKRKEKTLHCFSHIIPKIDIPILKTYIYTAPENECPNPDFNSSFAIYKKDEKYYVVDMNNGGLKVGKDFDDPEKYMMKDGEIRELQSGCKIAVKHSFFDKDKNIVFEFRTPKKYDASAAESYMQVVSKFPSKKEVSNFNRGFIEAMSRSNNQAKGVQKEFTFADVGGLDEQITELKKYVVRPLNYPDVYKNVRLNKGILLYGPPRCGKTLLGKALANEAESKFKYLNANEFVSSTVGSSEANVRESFNKIMQEPSILFIDEFDAIGKKRDGSSNARFQDTVVNQLLGCMSDLEKSYTNSFVIAATNRKDLLDEALISSGRFGLHLEIPLPDEKALGQIYDIHSKNQPIDENVSKSAIIEMMATEKFTGSDVAEMFTVGYFNALERLGMDKKMDAKLFRFEDLKNIKVSLEDLVQAISKISAQKIKPV